MAAAAGATGGDKMRLMPNILVTGTPGTGKSTLAAELVSRLNKASGSAWTHIPVSDLVREKGYHGGRDEAFDTLVLDDDGEDRLLDDLEEQLAPGARVVEFHATELFPERWFDLVLVLRCAETSVLYDRLVRRGYSELKLQENASAEIMGVCADEAKASYEAAAVVELPSVTAADLESNVGRAVAWVAHWRAEHPHGVPVGGAEPAESSSSASAAAPEAAPAASSGSAFAMAAASLTGSPGH
ncbi:hypothetical protein FNF27_04602 [Cafeteria roenbergensis]|uniref:Adenylate kinase isoenzyme 6 homolog n=1 Tax=Cafeteria roenbergensis TaxID=33653 RepID=A0A5A8CM75_CAFRO|nr:hypothetical protein FNF31_07755 [Cafeteria roenbergensis]KAA0153808.1 hypothetical protein FNF29_02797 [Cafeteria roenbergensis]KAA0161329.1 hypothetical protein FNF28_05077 [Cafeteria roenbergensis]KAA0173845.1 hypothetical protein FNF27_04602 [Cafeteria roenbergensis]|eukprot:KAA0153808.1 hypothetical protein FNF29_02797 [Cafeteria roenbergensis]